AADLLVAQLRLGAGVPDRALLRPDPPALAAGGLRAALEAGDGRGCADGALRADAPLERDRPLRPRRAGGHRLADAARRALPPARLAESRAAERLVGANGAHPAQSLPHVSADAGRPGRGSDASRPARSRAGPGQGSGSAVLAGTAARECRAGAFPVT